MEDSKFLKAWTFVCGGLAVIIFGMALLSDAVTDASDLQIVQQKITAGMFAVFYLLNRTEKKDWS